ncbi:MAG: hypothetical protein IPO27_04010 [Bacteroidetes bacterium]|nr:hypothetical protein [Bacteroidota bacterium]
MRKILSLVSALFISVAVFAGNADLFKHDQNAVKSEFSSIENLDAYLNANPNMSYADVQDKNLVSDSKFNAEGSTLSAPKGGDCPPLGIPSFVWGCVLGWIGILLVYLLCGEREETKKAFMGCLIPTALVIIYYVVVVIIFASGF